MATRLYFSSTEEAAVTPNTDHLDWWSLYDDLLYLKMQPEKSNSAFLSVTKTQRAEDTYGSFVLAIEFVSPPLEGTGTITNQMKCQFRAKASAAFPVTDIENSMTIRVVSNDGSVDRVANQGGIYPYILDDAFADGSFESDFTNYPYFSSSDRSGFRSIDYQDGDRLVFDVGFNFNCMEWPDPCEPNVGYLEIGDAAASDLPEDDSTTTQLNPWIEFTETLTFKDEEPPVVIIHYRKFPVPPDARLAQSHQGKRQFPVIR